MVKRRADALGMTAVSLSLTAPFLAALWLTIWRPDYGSIGAILPLAIAFGAPVAYIVTGFAGPRLGRSVAALFTRGQREKQVSPTSVRTLQNSDTAQVPVDKPVTITPNTGSLSLSGSAPQVLLVSASDDIKVKVQDTLNTCDVVVASTSARAIFEIKSGPPRKVIFDTSPAGRVPDIQEIAKALGEELVLATLVLFSSRSSDKEDAEKLRQILKRFAKSKEQPPIVDLETLRTEVLR